jgi:hypothetical protein
MIDSSEPRIVMMNHSPLRRGSRSVPCASLYRDYNRTGTLRLRVSSAAAYMSGGAGWYAVAVTTGEEMRLLKVSGPKPYTIQMVTCRRADGREADFRMCLGPMSSMEPWVLDFAGWRYPVYPCKGGIKIDLLTPLAQTGPRQHRSDTHPTMPA